MTFTKAPAQSNFKVLSAPAFLLGFVIELNAVATVIPIKKQRVDIQLNEPNLLKI